MENDTWKMKANAGVIGPFIFHKSFFESSFAIEEEGRDI